MICDTLRGLKTTAPFPLTPAEADEVDPTPLAEGADGSLLAMDDDALFVSPDIGGGGSASSMIMNRCPAERFNMPRLPTWTFVIGPTGSSAVRYYGVESKPVRSHLDIRVSTGEVGGWFFSRGARGETGNL